MKRAFVINFRPYFLLTIHLDLRLCKLNDVVAHANFANSAGDALVIANMLVDKASLTLMKALLPVTEKLVTIRICNCDMDLEMLETLVQALESAVLGSSSSYLKLIEL